MRGEARVLRLGELAAKGGAFQFRAAPGPLRAAVGEELVLGVRYEYEEGGGGREATQLVLTVELDSIGPRRTDVRIGDTPFVHDESWGFLSCTAKPQRAGRLKGKFYVDAFYEEAGWVGGKKVREADFHHAGTFELVVE